MYIFLWLAKVKWIRFGVALVMVAVYIWKFKFQIKKIQILLETCQNCVMISVVFLLVLGNHFSKKMKIKQIILNM